MRVHHISAEAAVDAGQEYFVDGESGWHRSAVELRNVEVQLGHELTTSL